MLSPNLVALHCDASVLNDPAETTVQLAEHRGESGLDELDAGDEDLEPAGRRLSGLPFSVSPQHHA
jgi:hypothetical protein